MQLNVDINDVSETALMTLYCHAADAKRKKPVLNDRSAAETMDLLSRELLNSPKLIHRNLIHGRWSNAAVSHVAIRAREYDRLAREFIKLHPEKIPDSSS